MSKKIFAIFIPYQYVLGMSESNLQKLLNSDSVELQTCLPVEDDKRLSVDDLAKFDGFTLLDHEPPVIRVPKINPADLFIKEKPIIVEAPSYKQKHLKRSRPYAPRKIINPHFNSRKKGGR